MGMDMENAGIEDKRFEGNTTQERLEKIQQSDVNEMTRKMMRKILKDNRTMMS